MKFVILVLFVIAALAFVSREAWRRLSPPRKRAFMGAVSRSAALVRNQAIAMRQRLMRKQSAFRALFLGDDGDLSPQGQIALSHLSRFCYAFATTAHGKADRDELMRREGRRQVWIEVMRLLSLDPVDALNAAKLDEPVLG